MPEEEEEEVCVCRGEDWESDSASETDPWRSTRTSPALSPWSAPRNFSSFGRPSQFRLGNVETRQRLACSKTWAHCIYNKSMFFVADVPRQGLITYSLRRLESLSST